MVPATVILLCGLPASGKSTLAKDLKRRLSQNRCRVVHIEYDSVEDAIVSKQTQEERREAWNLARREAVKQLEQALKQHQDTDDELLVLMDDNYHLRGMRKGVHRLLLNYKPIKFGLIWMDIPARLCLERNSQRKRSVPDDVIVRMISSLETPRAAWENCWLNVSLDTDVADIIDFIAACSDICDLPDTEDIEQKEADRALTRKNEKHNTDKLLRTWVGVTAKQDKRLARGANDARKRVLQLLREEGSNLDDPDELLSTFLKFLLYSSNLSGESAQAQDLTHALKTSF